MTTLEIQQASGVVGLPKSLRERQIHVVMGKGGVGKSSVALALALSLWKQGRRVLLCQMHAPDAHGPLLGLEIGPDLVVPRERLTLVNIEPKAARREYVMMMLRFERLYDAIFENRFVNYFLRFIPSLAELNMIGKVYFHAEQLDGATRRYDAIVVDAPATGHGITLMRLSRVVSETTPPGPMRTQTLEMAKMFEDPRRTALHVVTTPDELSVLETEELVGRIRREKVGPTGAAFLNRVPEQLFDNLDVTPLRNLVGHPRLGDTAHTAIERERYEHASRTARERLAALNLPVIGLKESVVERFTFAETEEMAAQIIPPPHTVEALT